MDTLENLAIAEPLCAKILALNAINKIDPEREEKYKVLGLTIPPASELCFWIGEGGYVMC